MSNAIYIKDTIFGPGASICLNSPTITGKAVDGKLYFYGGPESNYGFLHIPSMQCALQCVFCSGEENKKLSEEELQQKFAELKDRVFHEKDVQVEEDLAKVISGEGEYFDGMGELMDIYCPPMQTPLQLAIQRIKRWYFVEYQQK